MLPRRTWLLRLGPPVAAVLAAALLADLPALAGAPGSARGGIVAGCGDLAQAPSAPGSWWTSRPALAGDGTLVGWKLRAAAAGEPKPIVLDLPAATTVSGPVHGVVAVAIDEGMGSRVELLSTAGRCSAVVYRSADVVRRAVLDPSGRWVYFHRVARDGRADLGTWRLPLGGTDGPVRVLPPFDPSTGAGRRIGRIWSTDLRFNVEGDRLAVQSCGVVECATRLVDVNATTLSIVATLAVPGQGTLIGFDRERIVTFAACGGRPCPLQVTSISSGRMSVLLEDVVDAATIRGSNGLIAVAMLAEAGARTISVDVATDRLLRTSDSLAGRLAPIGPAAAAGVEVGSGRVTLFPTTAGGAFSPDLDPGRALVFDPLNDRTFPAGQEAP
jgi:hypothetical protein